jgi:hypothetical protein
MSAQRRDSSSRSRSRDAPLLRSIADIPLGGGQPPWGPAARDAALTYQDNFNRRAAMTELIWELNQMSVAVTRYGRRILITRPATTTDVHADRRIHSPYVVMCPDAFAAGRMPDITDGACQMRWRVDYRCNWVECDYRCHRTFDQFLPEAVVGHPQMPRPPYRLRIRAISTPRCHFMRMEESSVVMTHLAYKDDVTSLDAAGTLPFHLVGVVDSTPRRCDAWIREGTRR